VSVLVAAAVAPQLDVDVGRALGVAEISGQVGLRELESVLPLEDYSILPKAVYNLGSAAD
jgi:hypothetical protein